MVLPARGLNGQGMGGCQVEQPLLDKEFVRPAVMIQASTSTAATLAFAEHAPQSASDPAIECGEGGPPRVLEVTEPATQRLIETGDNHRQARSVGAFRFRANRVFEFLQALLPREATMLHESVAQEFSFLTRIYG